MARVWHVTEATLVDTGWPPGPAAAATGERWRLATIALLICRWL
jgi:hypothetical protein